MLRIFGGVIEHTSYDFLGKKRAARVEKITGKIQQRRSGTAAAVAAAEGPSADVTAADDSPEGGSDDDAPKEEKVFRDDASDDPAEKAGDAETGTDQQDRSNSTEGWK